MGQPHSSRANLSPAGRKVYNAKKVYNQYLKNIELYGFVDHTISSQAFRYSALGARVLV
jgi:hypothetical protein